MVRATTLICLAAGLLAVSGTTPAQQHERLVRGDMLLIERAHHAERSMAVPARGLSMAEVERRHGAPSQKHAPVGGGHPQRPPITRWSYPDFSVYFERSTVINSVANRLDHETGPKPASR